MRTQAWVHEGPDALISLVKIPWRTLDNSHRLDANFYTNYINDSLNTSSDESLDIFIYQGSLALFGVLIVPSDTENVDVDWTRRLETLYILVNTTNTDPIHTEAVHRTNSVIHKIKHCEHFATSTESGPQVLFVFLVEVALQYGSEDEILPLSITFEHESRQGPFTHCTLECRLVERQILSVEHRLVLNYLQVELKNLHGKLSRRFNFTNFADVWDAQVDEVSPSGINHEASSAQVPTLLKAGQRQSLLYKIEPMSLFRPCFLCIKWRVAIAQASECQWLRMEIREPLDMEFTESDAIQVWCSINQVNLSLVSINVKIKALKAVNLILENDASDLGAKGSLLPIVKIIKIGRLDPGNEKLLVIHYNVINRGLNRISRFKIRDVLCSQVYKMRRDFYVMA